MVARTNDIGTFHNIRLRQNAAGVWHVWWTDTAGPRVVTKRESCRTTIESEARAYLDQFCAGAREIPVGPAAPRRHTVGTIIEAWLDDALRAGRHFNLAYVARPVVAILGNFRPEQLDRKALIDYRKQRGRLSDGTIRRELGVLQTALGWAVTEKLIDPVVVPSFKGVKPSAGAVRDRFLDQGQEPWFWDQAMLAPPRIKLFAAVAMETAARREAVLELTWDRVDLARGVIEFRKPGRAITKKRRGPVAISNRLRPVLEAAMLAAPRDPTGKAVGPVVPAARSIRQWSCEWARWTAAIGMGWVTPHVLRHTWGSLAIMAGVSVFDVAQIMHDTVATIEKHYAHLTAQHKASIVNFKQGLPAPALRVVSNG